MKKILFTLLLVWFWPVLQANSQQVSPNWILFSELSPTPRLGDHRILQATNENFHLEWRNRLGLMVSNDIAIGLMGTLRQYNLSEAITYSLEWSSANYAYEYNIKNSLWGTGPFISKLFQICNRLQFQATVYGLFETGKGSYNMTLTGFECPNCFTTGLGTFVKTGNIEHHEYRERSFYTGVDFGTAYALTPRLSLLAGINLIQYESYSISDGNRLSPTLSTSPLYRRLDSQGNEITTLFNQPIVHLGMMLAIGKRPI